MAESTSSGKPLRVGVVGAGYVSRHHIGALKTLPFVTIVGVADARLEAARQLADSSGVTFACATLDELLTQSPDCVLVLTPPSSHAALSIRALEAGCHVFVEKPMAETEQECQAMMAAAEKAGKVLSVNHSDLFDPVVRRARDLVKAGRCGDVLAVDIVRSSEYPPYAGGALPGMVSKGSYPFQDLGVHALYQVEAFLGAIQRVDVGFEGTGRHPNLRFDEWVITAHCERGIGRIWLSWNARPMSNRLVVHGTRGRIDLDKFLQTCVFTRLWPGPKFIGMVLSGLIDPLRSVLQVSGSVFKFVTGRLKGSPGIVAGSIAFVRSLHEGQPPPVAAADAARIVRLMEPASQRADEQWASEQAERRQPVAPVRNLVTGAAGMLGRALVERLLADGESVRVLVRRPDPALAARPGLQVIVGDLGDPAAVDQAVQGTERVFHVGAAMKGYKEDFQSGTIWGTRNVLDACRKHGVSRLVHVSSMSVVDHAGNDPSVTLSENARYEPFPERRGLYTQTKLESEQMVRMAIADGSVNAVIVRPGQIFGPGTERVAPNGVIAIASRWIVVGSGGNTLPLVHRDDVIDGLIAAAASEQAAGQIIHLVDPQTVTQREYLAALGAARPPVVHASERTMLMLASGVELLGRVLRRGVPLTQYRVRSIRPLSNFDTSSARRLLNWTPRVGVREGLRRMVGDVGRST